MPVHCLYFNLRLNFNLARGASPHAPPTPPPHSNLAAMMLPKQLPMLTDPAAHAAGRVGNTERVHRRRARTCGVLADVAPCLPHTHVRWPSVF